MLGLAMPDQNPAHLMTRFHYNFRSEGHTPYLIPVGGSNTVGTWGYIEAYRELMDQVSAKYETVYVRTYITTVEPNRFPRIQTTFVSNADTSLVTLFHLSGSLQYSGLPDTHTV